MLSLVLLSLLGLVLLSIADYNKLSNKIEKSTITRSEYDEMKKRLIVSEALVKKCTENDTIDIMKYVRDVKREIEVEFERD